MAHAARLNLRMQKELTLFLTDPPPGVSLCNDFSSSSSSSLSSIDAVIKGPEGTVYANGVFKINIQIPDRYPFQPPNVTFATPIYHPNIDNGGRICLDILNLPPKGAWQPSLNISTVLMSIGLLLGEPNPDDGLMCEASREYKYNRQTFDQKARSVTEKYANSGISVSITSSGGTPANQSLLMIEAEKHSLEPRNIDNVCNVDQEKHNMANRKLSLEFLGPLQKRNYDDKDSVAHTDKSSFLNSQSLAVNPSTFLLTPKFGVNHELPLCQDNTGKVENNSINTSPKKLSGDAQKLSLKSVGPFLKAVSNDKENMGQTLCSDKDTEVVSMKLSDSPGIGSDIDQKCIRDQGGDAGSVGTNQSRKKLYGIGRKLSLHSSCTPQEGKTHKHTHSSESFSVSPRLSLMPLNDNCDGKRLHEVHNEKAKEGIPNMSSKMSGITKHSMKMSTTFKNKNDDDNNENIPPNYQLALDKAWTTSSSIIVPQSGIKDAQLQHQKHNQVGISQKRPLGIGKTLLMHSPGLTRRKDGDHKANVPPVENLSFSKMAQLPHAATHTEELDQYSGETAENRNINKKEEAVALITDAVIVLDSEDSDEEVKGPTRSRLSLGRKPLTGKRKVKA